MADVRPAVGRRAVRLAAITAAQDDLDDLDRTAQSEDWNEALAFNLDHRNAAWRRLEDERRVTLSA